MVTFSPNEIAESIIEKYKVDFVIMINLKGKSVYMRRNKNCTLNMGKLAAKLIDGGGHEDAAGGILNESIINITKFLKPI
jgi:oligoribonuclease NrnB/cAMP/cGMP phosphodiesterase (DHH superfamily)